MEKKRLKLSTVSRIIPGQRTVVFKRYFHLVKDYLSFSLLYNNGERSLDLDKAETKVWFVGLKVVTGRNSNKRTRSDLSEIVCGVRHVALVTRQVNKVDFVACGEHHSCAISISGDLFTWGDGTHNVGLLGHGTDVSHWIPKRVCGPLEGLQVLSIACGTWHIALAIASGKLFTFGDGSFAIVELTGHSGANMSSRKLFSWDDGDKYRLGHGSKDTYLLPTYVSSLIDYSFHQPSLHQAMSLSWVVLHMKSFVGHHVAVLTWRSEVLTWGRGANGRLGHGDIDDQKTLTVIDALKDRKVYKRWEPNTGCPVTYMIYKKESIEQFEPGVYITFVQRQDGSAVFTRFRFRFSKRRFNSQQGGVETKIVCLRGTISRAVRQLLQLHHPLIQHPECGAL
ncbi:hypothetical protein Pint_19662 [Pistacia integerrima]|uniref:Uncharacterized protein n=1 Tax=Pistacia integerrima TaxID=434235 RepID=A0ACC0XCV8_9ROSI|nr:hypothetical protein Pint_19662 [Pistacia integerrima]